MKKFKKLDFIASILFLISIILDIIELFNEELIIINYFSLAFLMAALILYIISWIKIKKSNSK